MRHRTLAIIGVLLLTIPAVAGTWTPNNFLYKPSTGARGEVEKKVFENALDQLDQRLGKEIWVGDPGRGTTLQGAVTGIGGNQVMLRIPAGTWSIDANFTIPANVTLKPERGAILAVATGKTLTINGSLDAGPYQIFSCTGTGKVAFGKGTIKAAYPEWFGCNVAGTGAANALALQALLDAICHTDSGYGNEILFGNGTYTINGPVVVQSTVNFKGVNQAATIIYNGDVAGANLINLVNTRDAGVETPFHVSFEDLELRGNSLSGIGIYAYRPFYFYMNRCTVNNHGGQALHLKLGTTSPAYGQTIFINQTQIQNNKSGGIKLDGNLASVAITRCVFSGPNNVWKAYGVYSAGAVSLTIAECAFGGYAYDVASAKQSYPIVLSTGNNITIRDNHFETYGGEVGGTAIGSAIMTAMNGDTQAAVAGNTQVLSIYGNNFNPAGAITGDINHITLNYVLTATIGPGNLFNKGATYTGTVNGIFLGPNIGTNGGIVFLHNRWSTTLAARVTGCATIQYIWNDMGPASTDGSQYGCVGRPAADVAFFTRRYDRTYNTFQVGQLGTISMGDGSVAPDVWIKSNAAKGLAIGNSDMANGQHFLIKSATIEKTALSGATVTWSSAIPAGSLIIGVTARVTTLITGATSFDIGDGTTADKFGNDVAVAAGTTSTLSNGTATAPTIYPAATSIVLTANGSNFTAGAVRLTVHYIQLTAPSS